LSDGLAGSKTPRAFGIDSHLAVLVLDKQYTIDGLRSFAGFVSLQNIM
jgi:hypothetical protein